MGGQVNDTVASEILSMDPYPFRTHCRLNQILEIEFKRNSLTGAYSDAWVSKYGELCRRHMDQIFNLTSEIKKIILTIQDEPHPTLLPIVIVDITEEILEIRIGRTYYDCPINIPELKDYRGQTLYVGISQ